jgi:mannose-6-phosphate isomerase-like protein (cupin superfamily)
MDSVVARAAAAQTGRMTEHTRRKVIGGLATTAIAALALDAVSGGTAKAAVASTAAPGQDCCGAGSVRRYVVGSDPDGKSYTQFSDSIAAKAIPGLPGGGVVEGGALWATHQMPVDNSGSSDAAVGGSGGPGSGTDGTSFGFIYYPPGQPGTQPIIHRTATTDYWVILEGAATLFTDKDEIHLKAGDTVIVRGAYHGWSHPSDRAFLAITVSLDAVPSSP